MKDPSRLLERGASDLERLLLEAGIREEPGADGVGRTAAALGVAAVVSSASPMAAAAAVAQKVWWATWVKWAVLASTGPGLAVTFALSMQRPGAGEQQNAPPAEVQAPAAQVHAPAIVTGEPSAVPPDAATGAQLSTATSASPRGRPGPATSTLKDEIASLDRARADLHRGDPASALRTLDRYRREYPGGVLREEALLLRIEALAQSGDRVAAERLARRLLARNPGSPHAKRLASLLGPEILDAPSAPRRD